MCRRSRLNLNLSCVNPPAWHPHVCDPKRHATADIILYQRASRISSESKRPCSPGRTSPSPMCPSTWTAESRAMGPSLGLPTSASRTTQELCHHSGAFTIGQWCRSCLLILRKLQKAKECPDNPAYMARPLLFNDLRTFCTAPASSVHRTRTVRARTSRS